MSDAVCFPEDAEMAATYLYGVLSGEHTLDVGSCGLPGGSAPVYSIPAAGLSALVSDYDGPHVTELPREQLLHSLIVHQQVLEKVGDRPLLPAKLGTLLASEDEAQDVLTRFRARFEDAMNEIGDAVEIDLSATWDLKTVLAEVGAMPDLARMAQEIRDPEADESFALRLELGRLVQERVAERSGALRRHVVGALTRYALDAEPNTRLTDEVVFNVAFLVERDALSEFDAHVDTLGTELDGQLELRYVGPLPPYSFGTVELSRPDTERIRVARELLGLSGPATKAEVEQAYRRTAALLHPDVNRDDPLAGERFAALVAARADLDAYMSADRGGDPGNDHTVYDLSEDAVRSAILLAIRRGEPQPGETMDYRYESRAGA